MAKTEKQVVKINLTDARIAIENALDALAVKVAEKSGNEYFTTGERTIEFPGTLNGAPVTLQARMSAFLSMPTLAPAAEVREAAALATVQRAQANLSPEAKRKLAEALLAEL